ncbi:Formin-like protein 1 [Amphibalanus amphitrite]|uniref:Formin-like protein 1 n=1 Tax=Amphibalanus amphitrite TaxID=1232801 RepID=A0A6A4W2C0_AMPAM|nr:Formin-like protein 1 [Amphibalanus amphitrite]
MSGTLRSKEHHNFFRRALTDEYDCLICLKHCLRCEKTASKLVNYSHGLYTVAVCIMSNFSKSRILALELLTVACETPPRGHKQVMEAASTLRLRFGEPVRFKFLVGMLTSFGSPSFQAACLRFLNRLTELAADKKERVHLQAEIEEAGFDVNVLRKFLSNSNETAAVREELDRWQHQYVDVDDLYEQLQAERAHTARLRAEKDDLSTELKNHATRIQSMRQNEDAQSARLQRLESQLTAAPHSRISRTSSRTSRGTLEPPGGAQVYPSFPAPPRDDAREADMSSTGSVLSSTLSSISLASRDERAASAEKERQIEEKEKESSGDEERKSRNRSESSTQGRHSPSDFEKEKLSGETIEVKNDIIMFDPSRPRSASSSQLPPRSERRVYQNVAPMPVAPCGRHSCEADDIREAMDQLTSVIDNAESNMSIASDRSGSSHADSLSPPPRKSRGSRERHIVPCRVPMPPGRTACRRHAAADQSEREETLTASSETSQNSLQRPTERRQSRPSSVVESESTRSFHYSRGAALRRRETFAEPAALGAGRLGVVQRSGSFHHGGGLSEARHWCGSVDQLSALVPRAAARIEERERGERADRGERAERVDRRASAGWSAAPRRARSRDELAPARSGKSGEEHERLQRAADLRMRRWLEERRAAEMAPPEPQRAPPVRPVRRRREPDPASSSGWGSGSGSGSGSASSDSQEPEERRGAGGGPEYRLPEPRGFVSRGHRNAGRYSSRHLQIPSPDYSSGTLSSATKMNMSSSVMDLPSALY